MSDAWLPLLLCMFAAAAWFRAMRLRERAVAQARGICARHGLQLLDDSVALHRLRLRWRRGRLHAFREYRFDTSLGGHDRHAAFITLHANRVVSSRLPRLETLEATPRADAGASSPGSGSAGSNVVPLTRARRSLH